MRSPFGALLAGVRNRAPVPVGSRFNTANLVLGALGGRGAQDDERLMATYGTVGILHAIVSRTSTAVSMVDWHLYRKAKSGKREDRVEVTTHAALDLWNKPNPFMPRQEFVETFQQHLELVGEADWVIGRAAGIAFPIELWPVRPDRIEPVPDPIEFIKGYIHTSVDGERTPLRVDEVVQLKMPNPLDPYRGMGPVQSLLTDLDGIKYGKEWNRNFFLNSAEPGGIIQVNRHLSDDEFDEMALRWEEQHRGVSKAHRIAIIEDATWVSNKFSQRDMQFSEMSDVADNAILKAFGFPRAMLGMTDGVNFAAAKAAEYMFGKWLTVPRLERIKAALNHDILPLFGTTGQGLEFDYDSPVQGDAVEEGALLAARSSAAVALVGAGWDDKAVLKTVDLPEMEFKAPTPPPVIAPLPPHSSPPPDPGKGKEKTSPPAPPTAEMTAWLIEEYENANRWVAVECKDDSTCEPCHANDGKLYKNREEAYKDYPDGIGYKDCIGAKYGNACRGKVVKRGKDK